MTTNGKQFSERLERVLVSDSKARFLKLVRDQPVENILSLVDKCAKLGAKKCLLALLNGEAGDTAAFDAHLPDSDTGVTTLAYVTHSCLDPQIIDLMSNRYNAIPLVNVSCTLASVEGLPIHFALIHLSYVGHLFFWTRGESLIKLVILCQWKTKPILDSVRLLSQYTDSINDIAWNFAKYGALKQFGALLLIAREKVMAPFDTGLTIRQYLTSEIDSFSKYDMSGDEVEYKNHLIDARQLIDIYEKAGDALSSYCSSMQRYVDVEKGIADVCMLLKEAGVYISTYDLMFGNSFEGRRGLSRIKSYKLAGPFRPSDSFHTPYLTVRPAGDESTRPYTSANIPMMKPIPVPNIVSSAFHPRLMSTTVSHVWKISKPSEHAHVNPSLKHLAYMVVKLKKGLRFF